MFSINIIHYKGSTFLNTIPILPRGEVQQNKYLVFFQNHIHEKTDDYKIGKDTWCVNIPSIIELDPEQKKGTREKLIKS